MNGVEELTIEELNALFDDEGSQDPPPANQQQEPGATGGEGGANNPDDTKDTTKAFAKRLRESTDKARTEERESIAKQLGYESYQDMTSKMAAKQLEDKGLNPDDVNPIVTKAVEEAKAQLQSDPEYLEYKRQKLKSFAQKELAEVSKLTGGEVTRLDQLKPETIQRWQQTGSLKNAYLEIEGESRITKLMGDQSKGGTQHLNQPNGGTQGETDTRPLTAAEKDAWRVFNPNMTDEELNKITVKTK